MRQAGMVRAGGRSGVGNGEEDRKAEGGTADGREEECRKRGGGMEKWGRPGGTGEEIGWICVLFC